MSVKVSALCWQLPLPPHEKLVLLRLADYADDHGGNIYPAVATVAHLCGLSERGVQYILKKLTADGLLFVLGNEGGGRGRTRHYCIDLDRAGQMAGPGGGHKNGAGKRAQRVQKPCTLSDPDETPQRVQTTTVKGAQALHPIRQGTVIEEDLCVTSASSPARAHTREAPPLPANVVPIKPPGRPEVLPAGWVPSAEQMALARSLGLKAPEMAVLKFRDYWRRKGAARDEAGWCDAWEWWVRKDVQDQRMQPRTADDAAARDLLDGLRADGLLVGEFR